MMKGWVRIGRRGEGKEGEEGDGKNKRGLLVTVVLRKMASQRTWMRETGVSRREG